MLDFDINTIEIGYKLVSIFLFNNFIVLKDSKSERNLSVTYVHCPAWLLS